MKPCLVSSSVRGLEAVAATVGCWDPFARQHPFALSLSPIVLSSSKSGKPTVANIATGPRAEGRFMRRRRDPSR
jgi:hypothetical protein